MNKGMDGIKKFDQDLSKKDTDLISKEINPLLKNY